MMVVDEQTLRTLGELGVSTVINRRRKTVRIYADGMYVDFEIVKEEDGVLHLVPKEVSYAYEAQKHENG